MKKMVMVLMMVFGLSAVFAKSFVVLTDDESVAYYAKHSEVENDAIKKLFKDGVIDGGFPESDWKSFTQIVVFDKTGCCNIIWVCTRDKKSFGISYSDDENYHCDTTVKTDPLQVGLNFIRKQVVQIYCVDDEKLIYNTYKTEPVEQQ